MTTTMIKYALLLLIVSSLTFCSNEDDSAPTNSIALPDSTFEALLVDRGIDTDGQVNGSISKTDAQAVTSLIIDDEGLLDLTGIEAFTNLIELDCSDNNLANLDISKNVLLEKLDCNSNAITTLNVDANTNLIELICENNNLTSIDLSNNTNLERLNLYNSGITTLDLSNNPNLITVSVHNNNLTALDISSNTNLEELSCNSNNITALDVSSNINLIALSCDNNRLTTLDISANPNILRLFCRNNNLTALNIKNGNNTNFNGFFSAINNPNLTTICVDRVPPPVSISGVGAVDAGVTFTTTCN